METDDIPSRSAADGRRVGPEGVAAGGCNSRNPIIHSFLFGGCLLFGRRLRAHWLVVLHSLRQWRQ